jgi:hypothetical protein
VDLNKPVSKRLYEEYREELKGLRKIGIALTETYISEESPHLYGDIMNILDKINNLLLCKDCENKRWPD